MADATGRPTPWQPFHEGAGIARGSLPELEGRTRSAGSGRSTGTAAGAEGGLPGRHRPAPAAAGAGAATRLTGGGGRGAGIRRGLGLDGGARRAQLSQSQQPAGAGGDVVGASFYGTADTVFAALFTAELLLNMAANLFRPFFRDPWNWFDTVRSPLRASCARREHEEEEAA